jgi:hypothetical protein
LIPFLSGENPIGSPVRKIWGTSRPGERTNLRLVSVTERRNGVVTLSYANA